MRVRNLVRRLSALSAIVLVLGLSVGAGASAAGAVGRATTPAVLTGASHVRSHTSAPQGYWMAASDGGVFAEGAAPFENSMGGTHLNKPVVGMAATPSSTGYWLVASDGGVFSFGDATFFGSMGGTHLNQPIVGMASTADGQGYWLVASDGGVFAFGDAGFRGSMGGTHLNQPVVGMAASPTGNGYWLVASDGGVFTFGDATFHGSMGGTHLNQPVVGVAGTSTGDGYWLVAADGGIFAFGNAAFDGSMGGTHLNQPIVGMSTTLDGAGYWMVAADGGIFAFGDAYFSGSMAGTHLNKPVVGMAPVGPTIGGHALLVGTFDGVPGQFSTIQDAVNAAQPGDWILVAPGDYHEQDDHINPPSPSDISLGWYGGVEVATNDIHIRGMSRSGVVVDGTKPGSSQCSSNMADQDFGVNGSSGPIGRNGIDIWANNVTVDNLTICNFPVISSTGGDGGNEIWWDGGDGTGKIGLTGYEGSYLTTTDTYYGPTSNALGSPVASGNYGVFSSGSQGPGVWNQIYGNNFTDSGVYIGACHQVCDAWIHNAWMENSALGYSGTNSGGTIVIDHSQFDNNDDGFDTNTQSAGDPPPPQDGSCPSGGVSGITGTHSCWVYMDNDSHDNNNAQAPGAGLSGEPVGTGMTIAGAKNDTIMDNTFANNKAWGTLFVPYPDSDPGPPGVCAASGGSTTAIPGAGFCTYDAQGDELLNNTYSNNGGYGNPTNGDYGLVTLSPGGGQNCFAGNTDDGAAATSDPSDLEQTQLPSSCGVTTTATTNGLNTVGPNSLLGQVLCDSGFAQSLGLGSICSNAHYPVPSVPPTMTSVPTSSLPTMPNPCQGVPDSGWCKGGQPV